MESNNNVEEALNRFKVGKTPLLSIEAQEFGLESIIVKDESVNHFGTFKDRKSREAAEYAYNSGVSYVMAITSGNYGLSLSNFLNLVGIGTILFVQDGLNDLIVPRLREKATLIPVDLEEEELTTEKLESIAGNYVNLSGKKVINATNFYGDAYLDIFKEIKRELDKDNKKPDYVVLPVGSGELFAVALRYYHLTDIKVIGVTTDNPKTQASMLYAKYRPSLDGVFRHENPERYWLIRANESEIIQAYNWTLTQGINSEHSAAAAFVALERYRGILKPSDTIVVLNTGNGMRNFS